MKNRTNKGSSCKDCDAVTFVPGKNGRNRYICTHRDSLRIVVHTCRRGCDDKPESSPKNCPKKGV